jgi:mono/diheme cytochrome c family protein
MRNWLLSCLMISLAGLCAPAASAGDATAGLVLARERCARCHNIEKGGAFKQRPPTFQSIAIYRTELDIWSHIIAPSPHSGMPDAAWQMTPDEVQDVLAYIISLDRPVSLAE